MAQLFVEARIVVFSGISALHSYIVYRDDLGQEWVIGGTSGGPGGGTFGTIDIYYDLLLEESGDARGSDTPADRGQVELTFPPGVDAADMYAILLQLAAQIEGQAITYDPLNDNSNSVTATLLQLAGIGFADVEPVPPEPTDVGPIGSGTVFGFDRNITGSDAAEVIFGAEGGDTLAGAGGNDTLDGGAGDDSLLGGRGFDMLFGGLGNDTLDGDIGRDRLEGGDGDDLLTGVDDRDTLLGGDGDDTLYGGPGDDTLRGNDGDDQVYGSLGDDLVVGGTGRDSLNGNYGDDTLRGTGGFDTVIGNVGSDAVYGGAQADYVDGGSGNDTVYGGGGYDTVVGGTGNDLLTGNYNADTFVFADGDGQDTITDFEALNGAERIDLSGVTAITGLADLELSSATSGAAIQVGADVVIDTGDGNSITLLGVSLGDLDASDFVF
ncbi:MAG: calcium-binding protein [Paracoccaceae bacterium]